MSDNRTVASGLLKEAHDTIIKKRPGVHGSAEQSFSLIADLWMVYLRHARRVRGNDRIKPEDVAQMMSMLKKARALYGDITNADNFVDDAGYTALAGMLQLPDPDAATATTEIEKAMSDAVVTGIGAVNVHLNERSDGGLDIQTKHTEIRGSSENELSARELMERLGGIKTDTN